jgi:hypothetical protein
LIKQNGGHVGVPATNMAAMTSRENNEWANV